MHIVGTLLWLGRNCYPEISQGLSQLCAVMSKPTEEAFDAAMHMVKYVQVITLQLPSQSILIPIYSNSVPFGKSLMRMSHQ
jgi:hypothetical protein